MPQPSAAVRFTPSRFSVLGPPGSVGGLGARNAFLRDLLATLGDARFLYAPLLTETTTSTDRTRNAATITYDATAAARYAALGSLVSTDFDGTDDEADTPDVNLLSFGDGAVDNPFSILVLCKPDVNNAAMTLLAKENASTAEEWALELNASGHLVCRTTDESASATLTGTYATAVGTAWTLLGATYDGSGVSRGITNFKNGARQTTAAATSGTYTAMENTAALVHLGARYTTKAQFFNGRIALAALCAKQLTENEMYHLKVLVNAVTGLSL